jgi:hypothetical protein
MVQSSTPRTTMHDDGAAVADGQPAGARLRLVDRRLEGLPPRQLQQPPRHPLRPDAPTGEALERRLVGVLHRPDDLGQRHAAKLLRDRDVLGQPGDEHLGCHDPLGAVPLDPLREQHLQP